MAYAELPGAQHGFDLLRSVRSDAVVAGIDAFLAGIIRTTSDGAAPRPPRIRHPHRDAGAWRPPPPVAEPRQVNVPRRRENIRPSSRPGTGGNASRGVRVPQSPWVLMLATVAPLAIYYGVRGLGFGALPSSGGGEGRAGVVMPG
ncbi:MAG: hypothetical protein WBL05_06035 [Brooklawnia sp.]|uniref:hypothetical protein n=1 Tax=Brooklawnia sp. TaxID=2699740 RepID=UPI003C70BD84